VNQSRFWCRTRQIEATTLCIAMVVTGIAIAQPLPEPESDPLSEQLDANVDRGDTIAPDTVEVEPRAQDEQIAHRLKNILAATDWFRSSQVKVNEGVVFLAGQTTEDTRKKWAGDLARNTRDVVAVVNRIEVDPPPVWDSSYVRAQLSAIGRSVVRAIPLIVFAIVVLSSAWLVTSVLSRVLQRSLVQRLPSHLLRKTAARAIGTLFFLVVLFLVLQVAGLTRLALTVAGGTGVIGLALGIAFKDITENFLASIYLSIQKPFEIADLVQIDGILGYVQRVTARTTILMTLDGNHVQIPNSTVFKNTLRNFTSNPNRRLDFQIGIGYDDPITKAQAVAMKVLHDHAAILKDPEPWVLVESLGSSTVNLRVYLWLDGTIHNPLKVQSAAIRLIKRAMQDAGISLPDEAREILFPNGVPVQITRNGDDSAPKPRQSLGKDSETTRELEPEASASEGNLSSDAQEIHDQASQSRLPELGENLLSAKPLPQAAAAERNENAP
jgi:small conductance mechanosensitive channel